jgi:cation-transporting ATPase E
MRDILRLYLTRNFVLAAVVGILLLLFGKLPMLPVQSTVYALVSVSFAAFLMAIWAKPSNNKALILPGVLRFSVPMAVMIAGFGLLVYFVFLHFTANGTFDLGEGFYDSLYHSFDSSPTWSDEASFWEHMAISGETHAEVTARNAMLFFLMVSGISQLFFIYPLFKFYSIDGIVSKDIKPTILALLLFGLVALLYNVPIASVGIVSLAIFPLEYFLLICGFITLWFIFVVVLLRSRFFGKISESTETAYKKSLEAEIEKEE